MRVTVLGIDQTIASTRYRAMAPAKYLRSHGIDLCGDDGDLLIVGKHGWDKSLVDRYKAFIFDVCDDWFADKELGPFYREMVRRAAVVTCNSDVMRFRIHQETGRAATVIPDAFEREEWAPSWGEGLLWFGNPLNLPDFFRAVQKLEGLDLPLGCISRHEDYMSEELRQLIIPWSPTAMDKGFKSAAVVILPTGASPAKSANRLIESVRAGKFVVAEPLPAYEEFADFMWVGDIRQGVEWAVANKAECFKRVKRAQKYIAKHYSIDVIGEKWLAAVKEAYPWGQVLTGA
jgi:hypothetical protein